MSVGAVKSQFFTFASERKPLRLHCGETLGPVTLAYETYGTLNRTRSNAILVFHAMTGSQHAAGLNRALPQADAGWTAECHVGWWNDFIGPDKALDTRRFFVICINYLGGCYGSTGPASINPATGRAYGAAFPTVRLADIVDSQVRVLDHLKIRRLHACIGGSIGGMMCLVLATRYPERVGIVVPVAAGMEVSTLQKLLNFEQIYAIEHDPNFRGGNYYDGPQPVRGLAMARMIAHKTFVSLPALTQRARHELKQASDDFYWYRLRHALESYMLHQGKTFVQRFDANTYLRILDAWQYFDLADEANAPSIDAAFRRCRGQQFLVFSIDSDVAYYPSEQQAMAEALKRAEVPVMRITVHSDKGHDSFLLEPKLFTPHIKAALEP